MEKFCGKCGQPLDRCTCAKPSVGSPARHSNVLRVGEAQIVLSDGEVLVRSSRISKHIFGKGEQTLVVTNKRVILCSDYRWLFNRVSIYNESDLSTVHGMAMNVDRRWSVCGLLAAVGCFLPFMAYNNIMSQVTRYSGIFGGSGSNFGGFLGLVIGFILMLIIGFIAVKPMVVVEITGGLDNRHMTSGVNNGFLGGAALFRAKLSAAAFLPCPDSDRLLAETGACLRDLRTYGDQAISKWQR